MGHWRGPRLDGVVSAGSTPAAWPASFTRVWSAAIGEGYSSPVASGGLVFVHSRRDPEEVVTAVHLDSGKPGVDQYGRADVHKLAGPGWRHAVRILE